MTHIHQMQAAERQVIIEVRDVYGNQLVYPVCATATRFAAMVGRKTFTHADLQHIEALGFVIFQKPRHLACRSA